MDERSESEELRDRYQSRVLQLEDEIQDLQTRLDDGDENLTKLNDEKKRLEVLILS